MNLQDLCNMSLTELAETCKKLRMTQEGTKALEVLLNRVDPIILQVGSTSSIPLRDVEDLMQEGRLCAIELVDTYNSTEDGAFESELRKKIKVRLEACKTHHLIAQNINVAKYVMENTACIYPRKERHEIQHVYMEACCSFLPPTFEDIVFGAILRDI